MDAATEHSKPCNTQVTENAHCMKPLLKRKQIPYMFTNFCGFFFFKLESAEPSCWPSTNPLLKEQVLTSATWSKLANKVKWMCATL